LNSEFVQLECQPALPLSQECLKIFSPENHRDNILKLPADVVRILCPSFVGKRFPEGLLIPSVMTDFINFTELDVRSFRYRFFLIVQCINLAVLQVNYNYKTAPGVMVIDGNPKKILKLWLVN
jgi:hypothetical protein